MTESTKSRIETLGFCQFITEHTRTWRGQAPSLLDHIWANKSELIINTSNIINASSDHNIITATIRVKGKEGISQIIEKRSKKDFSPDVYRKELEKVDWTPLYSDNNPDTAYYFLESKILNILDKMAPIIKIQPCKKSKSWISQETKQKWK